MMMKWQSVTNTFADLKKFITQTVLSFRAPYGTKVENYAKNFVIARTTNHEEYQKDRTGARRFLPFIVQKSYKNIILFLI